MVHDDLWCFVVIRDVSGCFVVVCDGSWWFVMLHGGLWWFVVFRDDSWCFMVVRDVSWWFVMVHGGFSLQFSRKYHVTHYLTNQSPRFSIKSHFEWDFVMVRDVSWWFVVVRDDSWWCVMVHDGLWWFVVVRDVSWWFVMVCGGFSLQFSRKYHVTHYLTNQSPRFSIKSHFEWDFVMVRDVSWWFRGGSWWFVVVHDDSWWFMVVRGGSWWFVVVRDVFFSRERSCDPLFNQSVSQIHYQLSFWMRLRDGLWWFIRDGFVVVRDGSWCFVMFYSLEKGHVTLFSTNQRPKFTMKSHFWWDFVFAPFHLKIIPLKSSAKNEEIFHERHKINNKCSTAVVMYCVGLPLPRSDVNPVTDMYN